MRVSFVGIIFVFMYAMFQALMRAIGQTKLPLYIVFGTVVLNFILDPLFIFGWGPTPGLGVMGAALATLVTQALAALIGMGIFLRGRHGIRLRWRALVPDPVWSKYWSEASISSIANLIALITVPVPHRRPG